jgi:hypothetical protein
MSLLVQPNLTPELLLQQDLLKKVAQIAYTPKMVLNGLYQGWLKAFDDLHGVPSKRPELLRLLGSDAGELFQLNAALTQFMISQLQGKRDDLVQEIMTKLASLPQFQFNPDGTVEEIVNP